MSYYVDNPFYYVDVCSQYVLEVTGNFSVEWVINGNIILFEINAEVLLNEYAGIGFSETPSIVCLL